MAKGNYGVTSLGGSNVSHVGESIRKGGYLPGVLEHGATPVASGNHKGNSIKDIASSYDNLRNNIASNFRKSLFKK